MTLIRMMLFYIVLRRAQDMQAPLIGMPYWDSVVARRHKPQVLMHFSQDKAEVSTPGDRPVTGQISFRLMDETSATLTEAKLKTIAQRIKSAFTTNNENIWYRGRNLASYTDQEKGICLNLVTDTKAHAVELIKTVCQIAGELYSGEYLRYSTPDDPSGSFPANPGNQNIMGASYKRPVRRKICKARFRYAVAIIHGKPAPIPLFDKTGKYIAPLVDQF
jgi:hypothetical protein